MPSDRMGSRGREAIYNWRVKAGKKEVFSDAVKHKCVEFVRANGGKLNGFKLRLIPPNL